LIADLSRLSGVSAVTIKAYIRRGLLARVKFYGTATRYPREHLVRLLAVKCLKAQGLKSLDDVRRRLDGWSPSEMERWVLHFPIHPTTLAALGHREATKTNSPAPNAPSEPKAASAPSNQSGGAGNRASHATGAAPAPAARLEGTAPDLTAMSDATAPDLTATLDATATFPNESWRRVVLLPGLELHLKHDAAPVTVRLAQRLLATYTELLEG
jgi:DNA-binding transcriptional MerR regulator